MMPENTLSSSSIFGAFLVPDRYDPLVDYEWGGVDLLDTSQGLQVKIWTCFFEHGQIKITDGMITHVILTIDNVTALSFAFDFNMRVNVAYVTNSETHFYWYDTALATEVTTRYGSDYKTPQLSLDDHRLHQSANADIIFAYIRDDNLCIRLQRERYQTEHVLAKCQELTQIGMTENFRFAFASKALNTFDANQDVGIVQRRNPAGSTLDHLMLCPLMAGYGFGFGDNTQKIEGIEHDLLSEGFENELNIVPVSFKLEAEDFEYFIAFYRLWQHKLAPFFIDLVIDRRPLDTYKVHFVPDSVSMSKNGPIYNLSAQLTVLENRYDKFANQVLAESRNMKIVRTS